jgi:hypothetical protein
MKGDWNLKGCCPVCSEALVDDLVKCELGDTPHHRVCWQYNGKCAIYSCNGKVCWQRVRFNAEEYRHPGGYRPSLEERPDPSKQLRPNIVGYKQRDPDRSRIPQYEIHPYDSVFLQHNTAAGLEELVGRVSYVKSLLEKEPVEIPKTLSIFSFIWMVWLQGLHIFLSISRSPFMTGTCRKYPPPIERRWNT